MKLISIIIPVYNTRVTDLQEAINSIEKQTYTNFEVLLVDDGSNDECAHYLDALCEKDERIRCIHRKKHGVSASRNFGTLNAQGDYVVYMDADDLLTPWCLEDGIDIIEKTHSDIVIGRIINTNSREEYDKLKSEKKSFRIVADSKDREELIVNLFTKQQPRWLLGESTSNVILNCEGCWSHIVRKQVAIDNIFREDLKIGEDTVWGLQLLENEEYTICVTDSLWYMYVQNPYSVMNQYKEDIVEVLTQSVNCVLALESTLSDVEYDAFVGWVITKLKQIIHRAYLHDKCQLTWKEKKCGIKSCTSSSPWIKIINSKRTMSNRNKMVLALHRYNLMIYIFAVKKYLRNKEAKAKQ